MKRNCTYQLIICFLVRIVRVRPSRRFLSKPLFDKAYPNQTERATIVHNTIPSMILIFRFVTMIASFGSGEARGEAMIVSWPCVGGTSDASTRKWSLLVISSPPRICSALPHGLKIGGGGDTVWGDSKCSGNGLASNRFNSICSMIPKVRA